MVDRCIILYPKSRGHRGSQVRSLPTYLPCMFDPLRDALENVGSGLGLTELVSEPVVLTSMLEFAELRPEFAVFLDGQFLIESIAVRSRGRSELVTLLRHKRRVEFRKNGAEFPADSRAFVDAEA